VPNIMGATLLSLYLCTKSEIEMGKYVLAWFLGVPAGLLMIIYLVMHH